jgi:predicted ATPase
LDNYFTVKEFKVLNNDKVIFDTVFVDEQSENRDSLFSTIVIGENGTGKSFLLSLIIEIFRALENIKSNKEYSLRYREYLLNYSINKHDYIIEIRNNKLYKIMKDGRDLNDIKTLILPWKVIAVSFMINDKFTFRNSNEEQESFYEYIGVRRTSNASWTSSIERKVCESLIENYNDPNFKKKVNEILQFLDFGPKITLIFKPTRKTLFERKIELKTIKKKYSNIKNKDEFRSDSVGKYSDKDLTEITNFINVISKEREKLKFDNVTSISYIIDFSKLENTDVLIKDYKLLKKLIELKLVESPLLKVYKGEYFDFEYASSGEKHILFTMINIAAKISDNSLVLIDEPELSLHPNWQMKYVNSFKRMFKDYKGCHFIMASHSHYIISDLEPNSSTIVSIKNTNNIKHLRKCELLDFDTYAWSAENVLYNVFGVRTVRNHYFEMDLRKLIKLISEKSNDIDSIEKLVKKLKNLSIDDSDPLNEVINEAERYLINVKN